jgi:LmbE family N-acetylglucosaminyl deacetylase
MRHVLFIGAHPDDCDFSCGGTAALLAARGDHVYFRSVTNGDRGHFAPEYLLDRGRLADRRLAEGKRAAAVIGASFETLGVADGEVYVTPELTEALIRLIRSCGPESVGPDLVLFNRPNDYHRDHRYTSRLVLDAAYLLTVPLMCPDTPRLGRMPVLACWYDRFQEGGPFRADVTVPIESVLDAKTSMVAEHGSQLYEWLPYNSGALDRVPAGDEERRVYARERVEARGAGVAAACAPGGTGCRFAEAFQISEYGRIPSRAELEDLFPAGSKISYGDSL